MKPGDLVYMIFDGDETPQIQTAILLCQFDKISLRQLSKWTCPRWEVLLPEGKNDIWFESDIVVAKDE